MAWESKGRGRPWRRKRQAALERDEYLCQPCKRLGKVTQATEVDHVIGVAEGGKDDEENLQSICHECHKAKTESENPAIRYSAKPKQGRPERKAKRITMLESRLKMAI